MKCIICYKEIEAPSGHTGDESTTQALYTNLYNVFRLYMKLNSEFENSFDFRRETFPFCRYCKLMLTQLHQLHEQVDYLSKLMTQIEAQISSMLVESEGSIDSVSDAEADEPLPRKRGRPSRKGMSKIENIRRAIIKRYRAVVAVRNEESVVPVDRDDGNHPMEYIKEELVAVGNIPVSTESTCPSIPVDETGGEDFGTESLNDQGDMCVSDSADSGQLNNETEADPDFQCSEEEDVEYKPVAASSSKCDRRRIRSKPDIIVDLGDNKFCFNDKIMFEVIGDECKCGECDFVCSSRKELLTQHIPTVHLCGKVEKSLITKQVGEGSFTYKDKFTFELVDGMYKCGACDFTSARKDGIQFHIRIRHVEGRARKLRQFSLEEKEPGKFIYGENCEFTVNEDGTFKCGICDSVKQRKIKMLLHMRNVHMAPVNPQACEICGKVFREKRKLQQHRAIHSEDRPWVCDICGEGFKIKAVLLKHKTIIHVGEEAKKHVCDICGKKFWNNFTLKEHMVSHTKEKLYKCPVCEKMFARNATLKLHIELHNEQRTFMCDICGNAYASQPHLNKHLRDHKRKENKPNKPRKKHFTVKRFTEEELKNAAEYVAKYLEV